MADRVHDAVNKIDSVEDKVDSVEVTLAAIGTSQHVMSSMWEHHLSWSSQEVERLWAAIRQTRGGQQHYDEEDR